ncbi:hypothetical protein Cri9333_0302 [Crinalium epipsammum PCC 9333]|uniref:Uncharacterized protein n=1 Tax=Crinalium epipsammum PCC 9333 TaxID=1173022 RepID=K9VT88_9CYAN|nr:hypothetical protein [Crinalium epipsammum]AFZ11288.1 hypothetical protein Cri9333_0302 [Crinalium epipsammum PCC 9333]
MNSNKSTKKTDTKPFSSYIWLELAPKLLKRKLSVINSKLARVHHKYDTYSELSQSSQSQNDQ